MNRIECVKSIVTPNMTYFFSLRLTPFRRLLFLMWLALGCCTTHMYASEEAGEGEKEASGPTEPYTGIYVTVPDILSNLHGDDTRNHFLKLCLTFEAKTNNDAKKMNEVMPVIVDQFLVYLRELRIDDLKGAEGLFLLKQQLLDRANVILSPVVVSRVLFREILVQ